MPKPKDIVAELQRSLVGGAEHFIERIPNQIELVIKRRVWAECLDRKGYPFESFEAFVTHKLPHGLESSVDDLLAFCRKASNVQALIRGEVGAELPHGGKEGNDNAAKDKKKNEGNNVTSVSRGNRATYTLRRLKRDHPKLAEKVTAGKMSANAAAVAAGFRVKTISVPLDVERAAATLAKHFSNRDRSRICALWNP